MRVAYVPSSNRGDSDQRPSAGFSNVPVVDLNSAIGSEEALLSLIKASLSISVVQYVFRQFIHLIEICVISFEARFGGFLFDSQDNSVLDN